jgi:preprotein translocase SecE subunit
MAYKKDQGRMARMTAYWSGTIFLFYGCVSLFRELTGRFEQLAQAVGGMEIPVLGMDLTPSLLITAVVFLGGSYLFYRWVERPKQADLLIETESEMRKVTWPSLSDTMSGSITVILTVLVLMAILALFDMALGNVATKLLT